MSGHDRSMTHSSSPRIGIAGITGRLGSLCAQEAGPLLAGGLSRHADPARNIVTDASTLAQSCDVIIDVSHASLVPHHAHAFSEAGCAWVLGTTGLDKTAQAAVNDASKTIAVLQAANFSPALTMLLALARELGAALPDYDAEIAETHHRQKIDAPSGTALAIGRAVAAGRNVPFDQVARMDQNEKRPDGAIGFASLRGGQVVGEHDLHFYAADEDITLSHRALDRRVFARGALKAAHWLAHHRDAGLYGMEDALRKHTD
ncbi:4-hydroxy-tetrahydrodipicolinate reductase [Saccharibacter sp. EH611]|nr:4-hydroxy-tetrahydrodipicolinate reductase [Saccharibacter sp. EH611]MXV58494.1 4-hydroxy-tetrahydrodipicolinate reductase [Saccharibacter sp. EH70]MXV66000.1 4-hydroxy-tetrahydrodipicolinate reductase [Saccharibacter sp. EH60]